MTGWVMAGLICNAVSCMWAVPAFDSDSYFATRKECMDYVAAIAPYNIMYFVIECRKTDSRKVS